jgi:hypothetical protein
VRERKWVSSQGEKKGVSGRGEENKNEGGVSALGKERGI